LTAAAAGNQDQHRVLKTEQYPVKLPWWLVVPPAARGFLCAVREELFYVSL